MAFIKRKLWGWVGKQQELAEEAPTGFANEPSAAAEVSGGEARCPWAVTIASAELASPKLLFFLSPPSKESWGTAKHKAQQPGKPTTKHWQLRDNISTPAWETFAFQHGAELNFWLPTWVPFFSQASLKPGRASPSLRLSLYSGFFFSLLKLNMQEESTNEKSVY